MGHGPHGCSRGPGLSLGEGPRLWAPWEQDGGGLGDPMKGLVELGSWGGHPFSGLPQFPPQLHCPQQTLQ